MEVKNIKNTLSSSVHKINSSAGCLNYPLPAKEIWGEVLIFYLCADVMLAFQCTIQLKWWTSHIHAENQLNLDDKLILNRNNLQLNYYCYLEVNVSGKLFIFILSLMQQARQKVILMRHVQHNIHNTFSLGSLEPNYSIHCYQFSILWHKVLAHAI